MGLFGVWEFWRKYLHIEREGGSERKQNKKVEVVTRKLDNIIDLAITGVKQINRYNKKNKTKKTAIYKMYSQTLLDISILLIYEVCWEVSSYFEYLENCLCNFDITNQRKPYWCMCEFAHGYADLM